MKNNGKNNNYDHFDKNHWRAWAWREIAKRTKKTRRAKVLYLSGEMDIDRAVAVRKGFSPNNLIAIDNSQKIINKLRAEKKGAICDDFTKQMIAGYRYYDVIYADFCCGMTKQALKFLGSLHYTAVRKRVVMVNLMRGRDKLGAEYIKNIKKHGDFGFAGNKRSLYALIFLRALIAEIILNLKCYTEDEQQVIFKGICDEMGYTTREYRGGSKDKPGAYFDSIVFTQYPIMKPLEKSVSIDSLACKNSKAKLAAAKAIRTMRFKGALPSSPRW